MPLHRRQDCAPGQSAGARAGGHTEEIDMKRTFSLVASCLLAALAPAARAQVASDCVGVPGHSSPSSTT